MQNDLISRSALIDHLNNGAINFKISMPESHVDTVKKVLAIFFEQIEKAIEEQPTAYDVENVVEQLKENSKIYCEEYHQREGSLYIQDAVEIVRNGEKE